MDISRALALKPGMTVSYPADRGDPKGSGKVTHVGTNVETNINGAKYIWVEVQMPLKKAVWPSNRLG